MVRSSSLASFGARILGGNTTPTTPTQGNSGSNLIGNSNYSISGKSFERGDSLDSLNSSEGNSNSRRGSLSQSQSRRGSGFSGQDNSSRRGSGFSTSGGNGSRRGSFVDISGTAAAEEDSNNSVSGSRRTSLVGATFNLIRSTRMTSGVNDIHYGPSGAMGATLQALLAKEKKKSDNSSSKTGSSANQAATSTGGPGDSSDFSSSYRSGAASYSYHMSRRGPNGYAGFSNPPLPGFSRFGSKSGKNNKVENQALARRTTLNKAIDELGESLKTAVSDGEKLVNHALRGVVSGESARRISSGEGNRRESAFSTPNLDTNSEKDSQVSQSPSLTPTLQKPQYSELESELNLDLQKGFQLVRWSVCQMVLKKILAEVPENIKQDWERRVGMTLGELDATWKLERGLLLMLVAEQEGELAMEGSTNGDTSVTPSTTAGTPTDSVQLPGSGSRSGSRRFQLRKSSSSSSVGSSKSESQSRRGSNASEVNTTGDDSNSTDQSQQPPPPSILDEVLRLSREALTSHLDEYPEKRQKRFVSLFLERGLDEYVHKKEQQMKKLDESDWGGLFKRIERETTIFSLNHQASNEGPQNILILEDNTAAECYSNSTPSKTAGRRTGNTSRPRSRSAGRKRYNAAGVKTPSKTSAGTSSSSSSAQKSAHKNHTSNTASASPLDDQQKQRNDTSLLSAAYSYHLDPNLYATRFREELFSRMDEKDGQYGIIVRRSKAAVLKILEDLKKLIPREPYEVSVGFNFMNLDYVMKTSMSLKKKIDEKFLLYEQHVRELVAKIRIILSKKRIPDWDPRNTLDALLLGDVEYAAGQARVKDHRIWEGVRAFEIDLVPVNRVGGGGNGCAGGPRRSPTSKREAVDDRLICAMGRLSKVIQLFCDVSSEIKAIPQAFIEQDQEVIRKAIAASNKKQIQNQSDSSEVVPCSVEAAAAAVAILRPSTSSGNRPGTGAVRPGTGAGNRPGTGAGNRPSDTVLSTRPGTSAGTNVVPPAALPAIYTDDQGNLKPIDVPMFLTILKLFTDRLSGLSERLLEMLDNCIISESEYSDSEEEKVFDSKIASSAAGGTSSFSWVGKSQKAVKGSPSPSPDKLRDAGVAGYGGGRGSSRSLTPNGSTKPAVGAPVKRSIGGSGSITTGRPKTPNADHQLPGLSTASLEGLPALFAGSGTSMAKRGGVNFAQASSLDSESSLNTSHSRKVKHHVKSSAEFQVRKTLSAWNSELRDTFHDYMPVFQQALSCKIEGMNLSQHEQQLHPGKDLDAASLLLLFVKRRNFLDLAKLKAVTVRTPEECMIRV